MPGYISGEAGDLKGCDICMCVKYEGVGDSREAESIKAEREGRAPSWSSDPSSLVLIVSDVLWVAVSATLDFCLKSFEPRDRERERDRRFDCDSGLLLGDKGLLSSETGGSTLFSTSAAEELPSVLSFFFSSTRVRSFSLLSPCVCKAGRRRPSFIRGSDAALLSIATAFALVSAAPLASMSLRDTAPNVQRNKVATKQR